MRITYDESADAAYIYFTDIDAGEVTQTVAADPESVAGQINLDFGVDGQLLGIEILDASRYLPAALLTDADKP